MKKNIYFFAWAIILQIGSISAQPTLTDVNSNPTVGEIFTINNCAAVSPGSAGANQTWNLSSMSSSAATTATYVTVASTPSGASFPAANIALSMGNNTYGYYYAGATVFRTHGIIGNGITFSYSNGEDNMHYPFNFNNTYTDVWANTFTSGGINFFRTGTTTVTADGYGTLITPNYTATNVMRIHFYQVYKDSANPGAPITINYTNDEYIWYKPGTHYAVASVFTLTAAGNPSNGGHYLNSIITSLDENAPQITSVNMYPVPAREQINLDLETFSGEVSAEIYSTAGANVRSLKLNVDSEPARIKTEDLAPGIYYIRLQGGNKTETLKFIVAD